MKLLIDMNLSPDWVAVLGEQGWETIHWTLVGDPRAPDSVIMAWARDNSCVVLTHDMDFGTILAINQAQGPSVVQIRTQDVLPSGLGQRLISILRQFETQLDTGALITVDEKKARVRILPFG
jgi:predicted nuclease of predicted toxin-antitoxin system